MLASQIKLSFYKQLNLIDIKFNYKNIFEKISSNSNSYNYECFSTALRLLKTKKFSGMINGPISKKHFLKGKYLGITEFLGQKTMIDGLNILDQIVICPATLFHHAR